VATGAGGGGGGGGAAAAAAADKYKSQCKRLGQLQVERMSRWIERCRVGRGVLSAVHCRWRWHCVET
jgi:hypothetical protein